MTRWLILLSALITAACASEPVQLPDWDIAEREQRQLVAPKQLPDLCEIPMNGQWSVECWQRLDAHDIIAEGNFEIAQSLASALEASDASYDQLLGAAKVQQELSQIRQELLKQERRAHAMDNWFYRAIIALGLLGAAL